MFLRCLGGVGHCIGHPFVETLVFGRRRRDRRFGKARIEADVEPAGKLPERGDALFSGSKLTTALGPSISMTFFILLRDRPATS